MIRSMPALILLLMFPSFSFTKQVVTFPSGDLTLHGIVFRPEGKGPFPAVIYNHGSYKDPTEAVEILGPVFASRGWVLFAPYRRGQGLSAAEGPFIGDEIAAARRSGGLPAAAATMIQLLRADHLNDQLAALAWLKTQDFVAPDRIAVAGNSFGGVEIVLGAERGSCCAAVDASGGAESRRLSPELQDLMTHAVRNSRVPIFFFQAANDYDLSPSRVKIYPAYGASAEEGHSFAYRGSSVWTDDVFAFLEKHCNRVP